MNSQVESSLFAVGLVQNGMLFGLLGLAIPILIHLRFRQRPRPISIGSIRFLQQIMEKRRASRRITRWLLLCLRLACIALLSLLFARPFLVEKANAKRDEEFVAILIDRSASIQLKLNGKRLVDIAVDEARKTLESAHDNTRFEIAMFDHQVTAVSSGNRQSQSKAHLASRIEAPQSLYSATDYAAAFRWARDICTMAESKNKIVHVFTDLQRSGLAWSDVQPMPADVKVRIHDLGRDLPNNLAVIDAKAKRPVVRPGESTTIEASVLNAGPFTLDEIPIALKLKNGSQIIRRREKLKLEPGAITTVSFDLPLLDEGLCHGSVTVESIDDMPFDNQRHTAMMAKPKYKVLAVDGAPHELSVRNNLDQLDLHPGVGVVAKNHVDIPVACRGCVQ